MHDTLRLTTPKRVSGTVLLVEDDEALARSLSRLIRAEGYDVVHAPTGAIAIDAVMNGSFDVVLSDLHLPGTTGIDVLDVVRAYDRDVPLVLMTGGPTTETAIAACRLGVIDYLLKPMTREDVARVLARATAARRSSAVRIEVSAHESVALASAQRAFAPTQPSMGVVVAPKNDTANLAGAFERALGSLEVELEPIVDTKIGLVGYAARMASMEETLSTEAALVVAADRLGRLQELRRRVRDQAVKAFVDAPPGALLFVDVHHSDLVDGDLYSPDPPLARIAERIVLQVRATGPALGLSDLPARASVLRFVGFRIAIADLDGAHARLSQLADLAPDFVKIDPRVVRGLDAAPQRQRIVAALVSMCRSLEAVPIAEGVATAEERDALVKAGCEMIQGSLVARHALPRRPPSNRPANAPTAPAATAKPVVSGVRSKEEREIDRELLHRAVG